MSLEQNQVYTDLKYGCDLVVKEITDTVVLIKELESGNSHLYGKEEFTDNDDRFVEKE